MKDEPNTVSCTVQWIEPNPAPAMATRKPLNVTVPADTTDAQAAALANLPDNAQNVTVNGRPAG